MAAKSPFVKITLEGTKVTIHPTGAIARARYRIEMNGSDDAPAGGNASKINLVSRALRTGKLPSIGSRQDFQTQTGPPISQYARLSNDLRMGSYDVAEIRSANTFYIDCIYESRPAPTIERGTSASQKQTNTYIAALASGGNAIFKRTQMVLDWTAPAGVFSQGIPGVATDPPSPTTMPRTPVAGSRMEFGSSFRISSTWYYDEIRQDQIDKLSWKFGTTLNSLPLFYLQVPGVDDSRLWMCTAINSVTNDGGYSTRISGEFVFSEIGWDTIAVYNLPYSDEPAFISQAVLDGLYAGLPLTNIGIPAPFVPPGGGAGRWPQQWSADLRPLVGFLSQGTLLAATPTVTDLLK